jgi:hypothetical protein
MSIQKIIQEAVNKNPLSLKEALEEELRSRVAAAVATKMEEVQLDEITKTALKRTISYIGPDGHPRTRTIPVRRNVKDQYTNLDKIREE